MNEISTIQMNTDQSDAIRHLTGPCVVIAPPGSGKTFTLVNRIKYLTKEVGISPDSILVISFTKAAALEMRERYLLLVKEQRTRVTFGTFHAVFYQMLRTSMPDRYGNKSIMTETEKRAIVAQIYQELPCEEEELPNVEAVLQEISKRKHMGRMTIEYDNNNGEACDFQKNESTQEGMHEKCDIMEMVIERYIKRCKMCQRMDFDDMAILCRQMLLEQSEILQVWQKQYQYVMIDEFQDIDPVQFEIIRMLAQPEQNLFVVGDDDQSIYGFRGADPAMMLSLEEIYPRIKKIVLKTNYRSGQKIIDASSELIAHNEMRFAKKINAYQKFQGSVVFQKLSTTEEQNERVLWWIKSWGDPEQTAIITRTNIGISQYAALLTCHGIPFCCMERTKDIFDHDVMKDIHAYFKLAFGCGERADFLRIMNRPVRYISRKALAQVEGDFLEATKIYYADKAYMQEMIEKFARDMERIQNFSPYAAIIYIRKGIGYEQSIRSKAVYGYRTIEESEEAMKVLDFMQESARGFRTYEEYHNWFEEKREAYRKQMLGGEGYMRKELKQGIQTQDLNKQKRGVRLMTMHGAKGLEYKYVIVPDLNEKNIPYKRAFLPQEIEEERRLLYVAMTRAKEQLVLMGILKPEDQKRELSRFVKEFGAVL